MFYTFIKLQQLKDTFIKLQQLKKDKACGPDGIHPKILKDCAETLAKLLFLIFMESLSRGVDWIGNWQTFLQFIRKDPGPWLVIIDQ